LTSVTPADTEPDNIPESLMRSVVNDSNTEVLFSLSDTIITDSIEAIKDSDLLSHIPITREIIGLIKAGFAYRDRRYISKLLSFLAETSKMSQEDKEQYTRKLDEDPKKAREAGETILDIIDKVTSRQKAIMVGKVVRAYGHEESLTYDLIMRICEIIERTYLQDLQGLQAGEGYNESNLESVGIIKPIRHEDIEKVVKAAIEAAEYASPTIKDGLTPPPPREPKIDRSGLTEEGSNLQRILRSY
jgi:hypothetical protein